MTDSSEAATAAATSGLTAEESGAGTLAAAYTRRWQRQQEDARATAAESSTEPILTPPPLPTAADADAGLIHPHRPQQLTDGTVVTTQTTKHIRMSNEVYLRSHPELSHLLSDYMAHVLETRPESKDILGDAVEYFVREGTKRGAEYALSQAKDAANGTAERKG